MNIQLIINPDTCILCLQGLSIDDFVSDVLSIPIFKSYIDYAVKLLSNLDHIFKKNGFEMISLQPAILNSLKGIKEEGNYYLLLLISKNIRKVFFNHLLYIVNFLNI